MNETIKIKINPFEPDKPATPDFFAGRIKETDQIFNALLRTNQNRSQHLLIVGERGIGKTSLAIYSDYIAESLGKKFESKELGKMRFFTVFCSLGLCKNTNDVCISIIENILNKLKKDQNTIFESLVSFLNRIQGINIGPFGIQITQKREPKIITEIFFNILTNIWERLVKKGYTAVLIILDETDRISKDNYFPSFFKSIMEKLTFENIGKIMFLITFNIVGLDLVNEGHPSFIRGFRIINIPLLEKKESFELVDKVLVRGVPKLGADDKFKTGIHFYSNGFPNFIHEIGHQAFEIAWGKESNILNHGYLIKGIIGSGNVKGALETLDEKHFKKRFYKDLQSPTYRNILRIIADEHSEGKEFVKLNDIKSKFEGDYSILTKYLSRLVNKEILVREIGKKGYYAIRERLFAIYVGLYERSYKLNK